MPVEKVGTPVGNPTFIPGIDLIYYVIMLKILIFPEISDKIPNFYRNLII